MPHSGGRFSPGFVSACSPPPSQLVIPASSSSTHWRVSSAPQASAAVAHSRKAEVDC